jgi:hypothetical protein
MILLRASFFALEWTSAIKTSRLFKRYSDEVRRSNDFALKI